MAGDPNMYVPRAYAKDDEGELYEFMRRLGLCTLVTLGDELEASLVPVVVQEALDGKPGTLRGHLARPNQQLARLRSDVRALAIFQGPAHYVTPSWYETKRRTGKVVPTYDYVVVQVRGFVRTFADHAGIVDHLTTLTAQHEASVDSDWNMSDAPQEYVESMLSGIVAFELRVDTIVGKWKLSQNRPDADIEGVVRGLDAVGTPTACEVARLVEASRPQRS